MTTLQKIYAIATEHKNAIISYADGLGVPFVTDKTASELADEFNACDGFAESADSIQRKTDLLCEYIGAGALLNPNYLRAGFAGGCPEWMTELISLLNLAWDEWDGEGSFEDYINPEPERGLTPAQIDYMAIAADAAKAEADRISHGDESCADHDDDLVYFNDDRVDYVAKADALMVPGKSNAKHEGQA